MFKILILALCMITLVGCDCSTRYVAVEGKGSQVVSQLQTIETGMMDGINYRIFKNIETGRIYIKFNQSGIIELLPKPQ